MRTEPAQKWTTAFFKTQQYRKPPNEIEAKFQQRENIEIRSDVSSRCKCMTEVPERSH